MGLSYMYVYRRKFIVRKIGSDNLNSQQVSYILHFIFAILATVWMFRNRRGWEKWTPIPVVFLAFLKEVTDSLLGGKFDYIDFTFSALAALIATCILSRMLYIQQKKKAKK